MLVQNGKYRELREKTAIICGGGGGTIFTYRHNYAHLQTFLMDVLSGATEIKMNLLTAGQSWHDAGVNTGFRTTRDRYRDCHV